jgi:hypothetical protein
MGERTGVVVLWGCGDVSKPLCACRTAGCDVVDVGNPEECACCMVLAP